VAFGSVRDGGGGFKEEEEEEEGGGIGLCEDVISFEQARRITMQSAWRNIRS